MPKKRPKPTELPDDDPDSKAPKLDSNQRNLVRDVLWTYGHLDHPRVRVGDAPAPGAFSLLTWARSARQRFYEQVLPRALNSKALPVPGQGNGSAEGGRKYSEEDMLREFEKMIDDSAADGATPEAIEDAEALVRSWSEDCGVGLAPAALHSVTCCMAGILGDCIRATARA